MKRFQNEEVIVKIKKKTEISFWEYQILGLLSFFTKKSNDYLFITDKRVLVIINEETITDIAYQDFNKIIFNPLNDTLKVYTINNKEIKISLKKLRLSYEEIQLLKNHIKTND